MTTFYFHKVAAGEPVDTGSLVCYMQPDVRAMVRELAFGPGGKAPHDFWILRPTPAADGNPPTRDEFRESVKQYADDMYQPGMRFGPEPYKEARAIWKVASNDAYVHLSKYFNWPAAGEAEPGMRWVKPGDGLPDPNKEVCFKSNDRLYLGKIDENGYFHPNGALYTYGPGAGEWLDESAPSAPVGVTREEAEVEYGKILGGLILEMWEKHSSGRRRKNMNLQEFNEAVCEIFDYLQGKAITAPVPDEKAIKQASSDYVSRNKLGVSTIGMRSGFEHGAAWAFSHFPLTAPDAVDPGKFAEWCSDEGWVRHFKKWHKQFADGTVSDINHTTAALIAEYIKSKTV